MKVEVIYRSADKIEDYDYHDAFIIIIDGKEVFSVSDGEPEDSNLSRDFSDCYNIPGLIERAYKAGEAGEDFEIVESDSDDI